MFITYWFLLFACIFFPVFWIGTKPAFRKIWLLIGSIIFHYRFAGPAGVLPIILLGISTYLSGLSNVRVLRFFTISLCVLTLVFYKYTTFIILQFIGIFNASFANEFLLHAKETWLPQAPPLAISFFVFEFVHYLVDVHKGKPPIRSLLDFTLFSIFWPSLVSGPIKRFGQFIPSVINGCQKVTALDIQIGMMRIVTGLIKKLIIADNLTGYIDYWHTYFFTPITLTQRWIFVVAISLRILFDFSGYSDIAIGFARLMGIRLPENFNWPYFATSLQDFWQRWHISLSTWIRDYIYIPLGGNKHGYWQKTRNGIVAFAACGLWHGAAWNFIFWGLYHGVGLVAFAQTQRFFTRKDIFSNVKFVTMPMACIVTYLYVAIGWIFFFYPIKEAMSMIVHLIIC